MKNTLKTFYFAGICALMAITGEAGILTPHALVTLPRPGGVSTAPSGKQVVYAQSQYNTTADKVSLGCYIIYAKLAYSNSSLKYRKEHQELTYIGFGKFQSGYRYHCVV
jgi:hypothetical protein